MVKKNISFRKKRGGGPIFYEATYNQNKNEVEVQYVDMGAKISDEMAQERKQLQAEKEQLQAEKEQLKTNIDTEKNEMKRSFEEQKKQLTSDLEAKMEKEKDELENERDELGQKRDEIESQQKLFQRLIDGKNKLILKLEEKLAEIVEEREKQLKLQSDEISNKKNTINENLLYKKDELEKLEIAITSKRKELESIKSNVTQLSENNQLSKKKLLEELTTLQNNTSAKKSEIVSLEEDQQKLKEVNENLEDLIQKSKKKIARINVSKNVSEKFISEYINEAITIVKSNSDPNGTTVSKKVEEFKKLSDQIKTQEAEITATKQTINQKQTEFNEKENEFKVKEEELNEKIRVLQEAQTQIKTSVTNSGDLQKIKDIVIKLVKKGDLNAYDELINLLPVDANEPLKTNESIFDFFKRISKKHDDLFFFVYEQLTLITMENMNLDIKNLKNTVFDSDSIEGLKKLSNQKICSIDNTCFISYYDKYYNIAMYFISIYNELMNSYVVKRLENIITISIQTTVDEQLEKLLKNDDDNHVKGLIYKLLDVPTDQQKLSVLSLYEKIIVSDDQMKEIIDNIMKFFFSEFQEFEKQQTKVFENKKKYESNFLKIENMLNYFVKVAKSLYLCQTLSEIGDFRIFLEKNLFSHLISYVKIRDNGRDLNSDIDFNTRYYYFTDTAQIKPGVYENSSLSLFYNGKLDYNFSYQDSSSPPTVKYDHLLNYGNFNKIFVNSSNKEVGQNMEEVIKKIDNKENVFIIGYGASGAGKTSTLIYDKISKLDGAIVYMLKQVDKLTKVTVTITELILNDSSYDIEPKTKLEDALDAMQPFVNRENFHDKYIKPYLEMQERLQ